MSLRAKNRNCSLFPVKEYEKVVSFPPKESYPPEDFLARETLTRFTQIVETNDKSYALDKPELWLLSSSFSLKPSLLAADRVAASPDGETLFGYDSFSALAGGSPSRRSVGVLWRSCETKTGSETSLVARLPNVETFCVGTGEIYFSSLFGGLFALEAEGKIRRLSDLSFDVCGPRSLVCLPSGILAFSDGEGIFFLDPKAKLKREGLACRQAQAWRGITPDGRGGVLFMPGVSQELYSLAPGQSSELEAKFPDMEIHSWCRSRSGPLLASATLIGEDTPLDENFKHFLLESR